MSHNWKSISVTQIELGKLELGTNNGFKRTQVNFSSIIFQEKNCLWEGNVSCRKLRNNRLAKAANV